MLDILACFICKQAFQYLNHANCCDNFVYVHVLPKAILDFSTQKIPLQISMRYYETTEWEKIRVEEEYNQCIEYTIAKTIKIKCPKNYFANKYEVL